MDRHTCNLCFRRFPNGRALGGHMRCHVTAATTKQTALPPAAYSPSPPPPAAAAASHLLQQHSSSSSPSFSASPPRQHQHTPIPPTASTYGSGGTSPAYVLRENPRKSYRMVDPEFSSTFAAPPPADQDYGYYSTTTSSPFFANGKANSNGNAANSNAIVHNHNNNNSSSAVVVQDGESETESSKAPPASSSRFRRSKRRRRYEPRSEADEEVDADDGEINGHRRIKKMIRVLSEPVSSVSDTTPDEDVAMCLMMLSRDVWTREGDGEERRGDEECEDDDDDDDAGEPPMAFEDDYLDDAGVHADPAVHEEEEEDDAEDMRLRVPKLRRKCGARARFQCGTCKKVFRSYQALGGHRASHKKAKTCSAAPAAISPLMTGYTAPPPNNTHPVRRPTPRIPVAKYDQQDRNDATHHRRRGHRYRSNNTHLTQRQYQIRDACDPDWGEEAEPDALPATPDPRIHECPFCFRVFSSGQALGGHKRSHLIGGPAYRIPYMPIPPNALRPSNHKPSPPVPHNRTSQPPPQSGYKLTVRAPATAKLADSFIDLNLPAPVDEADQDEDGSYVELSALSDAD